MPKFSSNEGVNLDSKPEVIIEEQKVGVSSKAEQHDHKNNDPEQDRKHIIEEIVPDVAQPQPALSSPSDGELSNGASFEEKK